jgi:hypothetical protein
MIRRAISRITITSSRPGIALAIDSAMSPTIPSSCPSICSPDGRV